MRSLVLLLLASCGLVAAIRKNGSKSLPKKLADLQDIQIGVSEADPILLKQEGAEAAPDACGISYACVYIENSCAVALELAFSYYSVGT